MLTTIVSIFGTMHLANLALLDMRSNTRVTFTRHTLTLLFIFMMGRLSIYIETVLKAAYGG